MVPMTKRNPYTQYTHCYLAGERGVRFGGNWLARSEIATRTTIFGGTPTEPIVYLTIHRFPAETVRVVTAEEADRATAGGGL